MDHWKGKLAIVTGCSSGIGESIALRLCRKGLIVVGLARRIDRLKALQCKITDEKFKFYFHGCDVADKSSVQTAFEWISKQFQAPSILVNCAGVLPATSILTEDNEEELESVINTNLLGSLYCIKEAHKLMKPAEGEFYIININSILGHTIFRTSTDVKINVYPSSKFGLRAAAEVLRMELANDKRFHVSSISPGLVRTEMVDTHPDASNFISNYPALSPEDIARCVEFILCMDSRVQIADIIIKPNGDKI